MPSPAFVCKTDRTGLVSLTVRGESALTRTAALHDALIQRFGRDIAGLFAEPVVSAEADKIGWYTEEAGEPLALASLDAEKAQATEARLREMLAVLAPALADPELGPLLAAALHVASANDILSINGRPLLVNWGLVPAHIAENPQALSRHFTETLGRYAPFPPPALARAARPPEARVPEASAPEAVTPAQYQALRAPLIAVGAATAVLLFLALPYVLRLWQGADFDTAYERAKALNDALGAKIAAVEAALAAAVCGPKGLTAPGHEATLPPPDPSQIKPPPAAVPPGQKPPENFNDYLDSAVVLVRGQKAGGSGFFIGPKLIVTNHHVTLDNPGLTIANRVLGTFIPVTVKAETPGTSDEPGGDFAVLEIGPDGPSAPAIMPLTSRAERRQDAVIAGYPGVYIREDKSAIPELVLTTAAIVQTASDQDPPVLGLNIPLNGGNSGGPLVDYCGRALGVNTFGTGKKREGGLVEMAHYALSARGLETFLDGNGIPYTKADEPCTPQLIAAGPSQSGRKTPAAPLQGGSKSPPPIPAPGSNGAAPGPNAPVQGWGGATAPAPSPNAPANFAPVLRGPDPATKR